jgi:tRNA-dihydrouridine synthase B
MALYLGTTKLQSKILLAPMAGVTDQPFRRIIREFGNFLMFSEMIASNAVIRNVKKTFKMLKGTEDEYTSIQIVGSDPKIMAEAAKLSVDLGARFIDINMGCPVKKIVKSEAGSALMKDEKLATKIIKSVVKAVEVPVSLKMRLGWNHEHKNAREIAKIAEDSGIQMITVHGRTRSQLYSGKADWKAIGEVKEVIKTIPIIANGDIASIDNARKCLYESGADGLMIGRGALGSPWILKQIQDNIEIQVNPI